jgi:D-alanyl-D-alanine dipeptidase
MRADGDGTPTHDFQTRIKRVQELLGETGLDALLLSVGSDLPYFTGYEAMASERLTMLTVTPGTEPVLFIPVLEAPRVDAGWLEVVPWGELEDPVAMVAERCSGARRLAIGDHTWSAFLVPLQKRLPDSEWSTASEVTSRLRMIKEPAEIAALGAAAAAVDRVLARIPGEVRFAGRSEVDISRDLAAMTVEEGHETAAFSIVASAENGASPHHEPGPRLISSGDLVVCDFGGRLGGYHSDVTRTFVVGEPTPDQIRAHAVVRAANHAGRQTVGPGVECQDVDRAARAVIDEAGHGDWFIHRTGHGIGLDVHEHPYIVEGNRLALRPGMAFSVEPGIYLPGEFGIRIEDIVVCGEDGLIDLNQASRDLVVVG